MEQNDGRQRQPFSTVHGRKTQAVVFAEPSPYGANAVAGAYCGWGEGLVSIPALAEPPGVEPDTKAVIVQIQKAYSW